MDKIFITGATGYLGQNLSSIFKRKFYIYRGFNKQKIIKSNEIKCNLRNLDKIKNFLKLNNIKFLIHCAGITDIELCEKNKKKCKAVNYFLTKKLVDICRYLKIKFIYISSDHLFDGKRPFKNEKEKTKPLNEYAKSKILSEEYIKKKLKNYLIIRTNFFGTSKSDIKKNFAQRIINDLKKNKRIYIFDDVYFSPISIIKLSRIICKLIWSKAKGTYNVSSDERISKHLYALKIANKFNLDQKLIIKSSIKDKSNSKLVLRPLDMSLNNKKVKDYLNIKSIKLNDCLDIFKHDYLKYKNK